jgi:hypothetical protein
MSVVRNDRVEILEYLKESISACAKRRERIPKSFALRCCGSPIKSPPTPLRLKRNWPPPGICPMKQRRFKVCRDRDAFGRPEGWFVEDAKNKSVLGRFTFRKDAQAMADQAYTMVMADPKQRGEP